MPAHIKNVPGQKTDKKDSEWITKLLLSGLLKGSFTPPQHIRELRELFRHRGKLIAMRTAEKNRLQNILESANIKLRSVVSDVFGVSAMEMVRAMAKGQLDPLLLASMAKGSLVKKHAELLKALTGKITDHHRFMLNLILQSIDHINLQIANQRLRWNSTQGSCSRSWNYWNLSLEYLPGWHWESFQKSVRTWPNLQHIRTFLHGLGFARATMRVQERSTPRK